MIRLTRIVYFLVLCLPFAAHAEDSKPLGGSVEAVTSEGKELTLPLLKTNIDAHIDGDLATVNVTQLFSNPSESPLHARYLFPLQEDAAVYRMVMEIGDEVVEANIQKVEEARKTFEAAKKEGKAASLLTEYRPNMFTQDIANLMPGLPVKVTISYVQTIKKIDGAYEMVMPLVVGPRYQRAAAPSISVNSSETFGAWELQQLPAYPPVAGLTLPDTIDDDRVSIQIHLKTGIQVKRVTSATHDIHIQKISDHEKDITLSKGSTIDNRDFILRYQLGADTTTEAGLLAHKDKRGGFFSLMLEPPALPAEKDIQPREMVFVLDTSGSMYGEPVDASKNFMRHALRALRPQDYFRIIRFSNNASEFTSGPVAATPENIRSGQRYVDSLDADGGTEIDTAVSQAFNVPQQKGTMRLVVFLTDGYIGDEAEVLSALKKQMGAARVYALGVGTSVNRYLLEEMARAGRGFARFIDPTEKAEDAAIQLANTLETPVLTDISIDWGDLKPTGTVPEVIPDLFAGSNIRIQGRYNSPGKHTVIVQGLINGRKAKLPVTIDLPADSDSSSEAIPLIWARTQIAEAMRTLTTPSNLRKSGISDNRLKETITKLGLDFSLTTRWTSFVAVSRKIVNGAPDEATQADVPLPMVAGVTAKAYGNGGNTNNQLTSLQNFSGGAAPEPATLGGLALLAASGFAAYRRRKQS